MVTCVVDPGHGGTKAASNSTPVGVVGPAGLREKDVVLSFAQRLLPRLGTRAVSTRTRDENLALADRIAIARRAGADAFFSIHANGGGRAERGAEVWIHDRAAPASLGMAESVARELRRLGGRARIGRGAFAILSPEHHAPHTAACLVELDYLSNPEGERWLRDVSTLDRMADSVALGARHALARQTVALDDPWPTRLKKVIPDDAGDAKQLEYTADVREAISAVFGLDAWDDVVAAGEKEMEKKLSDLLELIEKVPGAEEFKMAAVAAGALLIAELAPLGLGYAEAREKVARRWAAEGFAMGVVWAADDRSPTEAKQGRYAAVWTPYSLPKPGNDSTGPTGVDFDPATQRIARNCYRMGLIAGIASAKELSTTQKFNLLADLQLRDSAGHVDWSRLDAPPANRPIELYWGASSVFRTSHLEATD